MLAWSTAFTAETAQPVFKAQVAAGLVIVAPADWKPQLIKAGAALVLRSPLENGAADEFSLAARERARAAVSVVAQRLAAGTDRSVFVQRCIADLERLGTGLVIEERSLLRLGGSDFERLRYRFEIGPYRFVQIQHIAVVEGEGLCVVCGCGAEYFARWSRDFAALGAELRPVER